MITAYATEAVKENLHLTQVSFDKYLVQMNWVQNGVVPATTSSITIIDKKSHRVIQTITLGENNLWIDSRVVAHGGYLKMKDLDEDGYKDLWLYTNWGTGVHDHTVYRFNPKTETFTESYWHHENEYEKGEWKTTVKKIDSKNDLLSVQTTDKEIQHLTQVGFDEYLVQMNWVNECTSSMTIIKKKSHFVYDGIFTPAPNRVIQTISLEGDTDNLFVDSREVVNGFYLKMKDLDDDGHKDLWFDGGMNGSGRHTYSVYRFNPKTGIFDEKYWHISNFWWGADEKRKANTMLYKLVDGKQILVYETGDSFKEK
jgi:hypothetical protein